MTLPTGQIATMAARSTTITACHRADIESRKRWEFCARWNSHPWVGSDEVSQSLSRPLRASAGADLKKHLRAATDAVEAQGKL